MRPGNGRNGGEGASRKGRRADPRDAERPVRNAIVVLLDSLNRHMLGAYGGTEFETPNLDRFAASSVRFNKHYSGSLPCIPARHDILCGALDFLWKPWGSIEMWEDPITYQLFKAGITTQLISDHPHLFEAGGENYHTDFTAWSYERGHSGDPWRTRPDPSAVGAPVSNQGGFNPYSFSRTCFTGEADFPGPRTMAAATRWVEENADWHKGFFLFVDEFDPHEPFDTPEPWASKYDQDWEGPHLIWPPYSTDVQKKGRLNARECRQLRASYGGKLSMIDHWLGKLLDAIARKNLAENTLVIICTDHGIYLGEKDMWGKPASTIYESLNHIPLMIRHPGIEPGSCDALTANVDIYATLADWFGIQPDHTVHGRSILPLLEGKTNAIRDWALCGVWGRDVQLITTQLKYSRGPVRANRPLSIYSNRWSTRPYGASDKKLNYPLPDHRAVLDRMPGADVPVLHQRWEAADPVPLIASRFQPNGNRLFSLEQDPNEENNLAGTDLEAQCAALLRTALTEINAPRSQFERLTL